MKHLSEYINYNIYEEEINEGFWSWFGDLIKSMFTDTSKETRNFGESIFKYYDDNFDTNVVDYNKKIFKEKDTNKFIALTDEMYQNFIDKKILDKDEAIQWAIGNLNIKYRILKDENKNSDMQKINDKIDEYSKKNKHAVQKLADALKNNKKEE